jgi:hypothetical protein
MFSVKRTVTPEEFCETFMASVVLCMVDSKSRRTVCWGERLREIGQDAEKLRQMMVSEKTGYLAELARALELSHRSDYGVIDAVFYEKREAGATAPGSDIGDRVVVAIEYENGASQSSAAISRLSMLAAPLKVLITYPTERSASDGLLADYAYLLHRKSGMEKKDFASGYVAIFGFTGPQDIKFSYHIYRNGEFVNWTP